MATKRRRTKKNKNNETINDKLKRIGFNSLAIKSGFKQRKERNGLTRNNLYILACAFAFFLRYNPDSYRVCILYFFSMP